MRVLGAVTVLAAGLALAHAQTGPALGVDASASRHPISPDIYGINFYWSGESDYTLVADFSSPALLAAAADMRTSVRRWGGNNMTCYHWRFDVWNTDNDYFFETLLDNNPHPELLPDGSRFDRFLEYTRITGSKLMGTIPILGLLPKARARACSFSVARYGAQQSVDRFWTDCGNGVDLNGVNIANNETTDVYASVDHSLQSDWVKHVVSKYGAANQGGVAIWSLDNEPGWWHSTHRDMHPQYQTYDETAALGLEYAAAIKEADPTALVAGPVAANWGGYFFSARDMFTGNHVFWSDPIDRNAHNGVAFSSWYLQQFRNYEQQHGRRLLDYFDVNAYDLQPLGVSGAAGDANMQAARLRSTRVFWDPDYVSEAFYWNVDENGQPAKPRLIPRMHDWVNDNYPGTRLAISEYIWGALDHISGALAEADLLGIFGREGLDLATLWGTVSTTDPGAFAFKIYRNYDGMGGAFGETSVRATTGNPDQLSIFASQRSDTALTILVLNKTTGDLSSTVNVANFAPQGSVQVWRYSQANLNAIEPLASAAVIGGNAIQAIFPAYSMTLFVVPAAGQGPKPVVTGVANAASFQNRIAPGEMVVVSGTNLGPATPDGQIVLASNSVAATMMDSVRVLFDGIPAPLVYVSDQRCLAVVPYLAALKPTVHIQVEHQGVRSDPFQVDVSPTAPGLFTMNAQGSGQAAALNAGGLTLNSSAAPAAPGSVVAFWGTGEGVTNPLGVDGRLAIDILPQPVATCAIQIGGVAATIEYCGAAPFSVPGLFQINARIDPAVAPGNAVPVRVVIGGTPSQDGVTLVVR